MHILHTSSSKFGKQSTTLQLLSISSHFLPNATPPSFLCVNIMPHFLVIFACQLYFHASHSKHASFQDASYSLSLFHASATTMLVQLFLQLDTSLHPNYIILHSSACTLMHACLILQICSLRHVPSSHSYIL